MSVHAFRPSTEPHNLSEGPESSVKGSSGKGSKNLADYITFNDRELAASGRARPSRCPTSTRRTSTASIDIPADKWDPFFDARHDLVSFKLTDPATSSGR